MFFMILVKLHVWEKSGSSFVTWNALNQSASSILCLAISLEGINQYSTFFAWTQPSREGSI